MRTPAPARPWALCPVDLEGNHRENLGQSGLPCPGCATFVWKARASRHPITLGVDELPDNPFTASLQEAPDPLSSRRSWRTGKAPTFSTCSFPATRIEWFHFSPDSPSRECQSCMIPAGSRRQFPNPESTLGWVSPPGLAGAVPECCANAGGTPPAPPGLSRNRSTSRARMKRGGLVVSEGLRERLQNSS
jgi:hypothetical protein